MNGNTPDDTPRFLRVEGPGRCSTCSWHVGTQGHHPQCTGGTVETPPSRRLPKRRTPWTGDADVAEMCRRTAFLTPVKSQVPQNRKGRAYQLAALAGEAAKVAERLPGGRNHDLNAYTYKLRKKYVDNGDLTKDEVARAMFDAAVKCGHVRDDGASMAVGSIASGLGVSKDELQWLM